MMQYQWRITKYNPDLRDKTGVYTGDDWTGVFDVGKMQGGEILTVEEYLKTEELYVRSALNFFDESGITSLIVEDWSEGSYPTPVLHKYGLDIALDLRNGQLVGRDVVADVVRMLLREAGHCKLYRPEDFYLHVGWDYYLYIGSRVDLPVSITKTQESGLFAEPFASPYL